MKHDLLADVFSAIKNRETIGKKDAIVPESALSGEVLRIMQEGKYIGKVEKKGHSFTVELLGRINDCNVIKPRFSAGKDTFIKWEKRFLPANNIGMLIMSTSQGTMSHHKARESGIGGNLLGYVY